MKIIISAIQSYDTQVKEALKALARTGKTASKDTDSQIFAGRTAHTPTLKILLECLEFVILKSESKVEL